jgi:arginyl-tRNA synthetase
MKQHIESLLFSALKQLLEEKTLSFEPPTSLPISRAKNKEHGDFSSNIALILAKKVNMDPRDLAAKIIKYLPSSLKIRKVNIAGPGFINFYADDASFLQIIPEILKQGDRFGLSDAGQGKRIHIEYVSANPTGPLHVGHGRGAAFGACVSNLLSAIGYDVHREYYVNDAGRQMHILALSVWLRYLSLQGEATTFPPQAYQGGYIIDIAKQLCDQYEGRLHHTQESINRLLPADTNPSEEPDKSIDAHIAAAQKILGETNYGIVFNAALTGILADIRCDLADFGVTYDNWFHESKLFDGHLIEAGVQLLTDQGCVYEKEGAKWFKSTKFGDEKDRVLVRENGQPTYFASDVAYHLYKFQQGYHQIIDVLGADHHGYIGRIQAFLKALNEDPEKLRVLLVQFAILYRGKVKVPMSTRSGQFVTLRQLRDEVGNDAARFFYIMRKPEQHLDFDLELAKSKSNENPVYYIQYAHARICSIWRQLEEHKLSWDQASGLNNLSLLTNTHEKTLTTLLHQYPELVLKSGEQHEPHLIAHYLQDVANAFHSYYNAERFIVEQATLRNVRLCLISAIQQIFSNGLILLDVSAPQEM